MSDSASAESARGDRPAPPGVGLDLLEIQRLERALERRPRLAERLFTEGERGYAEARARPGQHLAARFCAKEALVKALGLPHAEWLEIEVVSPARGGVPEIALHGDLAARARALGVRGIRLSLTHSRIEAGAVVIIDWS